MRYTVILIVSAMTLSWSAATEAAPIFADDFNRSANPPDMGWVVFEDGHDISFDGSNLLFDFVNNDPPNVSFARSPIISSVGFNNVTATSTGGSTNGMAESSDNTRLQVDYGDGSGWQDVAGTTVTGNTGVNFSGVSLGASATDNPYIRLRWRQLNTGSANDDHRINELNVDGDVTGPNSIASIIFSDDGSTDPALNGWTVSGSGSATSTGSRIRLSEGSLGSPIIISRTINVTGFSQIGLEAYGNYTSLEPNNPFNFEYSTNGGDTWMSVFGAARTGGGIYDDLLNIGDVGLLDVRFTLDSNTADDQAFIDQFNVYGIMDADDFVIPEPATAGLLAVCAIAGLRGRRRG